MRSATAITFELDDIQFAADELVQQIKGKLEFGKEGVGILYAQPNMECGELSRILHEKLGCPIIGGTTAGGALLSSEGHHELAVLLHVLTSDDCFFSVAISDSMDQNPEQSIVDTYKQALHQLEQKDAGAQPKVIYCITSIVQSCSSDDTLAILSEECSGIPIFGFVAADDFEFCHQQLFLNGVSRNDAIAMLLISGNVNVIFEVKNLAGSQLLSKRKITKAHGNTICEIDGKPAYEYLKEFPFIDDETKVLWNYQFFTEMQNEADNDGISVSRALNTYDKITGEIECFAKVPENSYIGLQYCKDSDVVTSCKAALSDLKTKIAQAETSEYKYSTVLFASCSLRNMFLADQKNAEGELIHELLPASLVASGIYGFGEIAPTSVKNGKAVNRFHNATMIICAF